MKLPWKYLLFIVMPTLVAIIYFVFLVSAMYISESHFAIRSPEGGSSSEWLALLGQTGGSTTADAYILEDYILSSELLMELDQELDLRSHYQDVHKDFFSRLKTEPTREEFLKYYRKVITVRFDVATGILILKVRAYSAEMAKTVCRSILVSSERLVNDLRDRAMNDMLSLARHEVMVAEQRLAMARQDLSQFRQENDLLDPQAAAGAVLGLLAELEGQSAKVRTDLAELRSYMKEESSAIVALKARIQALEQQVRIEKSRLTGDDNHDFNKIFVRFEKMTVEHEFAQKQYFSALGSLEAARVRAESQNRYLEAFVAPTLPEEALWPSRGRSVGVSFAFSVLIFWIGSLVIASIREHAGN